MTDEGNQKQTSGGWFATHDEDLFYNALLRGDLLLFEGYDDMASVGSFLERRPVYHSALWWGRIKWGNETHQCAVHNVSHLWWGHAAAVAGAEKPKEKRWHRL